MFMYLLTFALSAFCAVSCMDFTSTVNVTASVEELNRAMVYCENNLSVMMKLVCKMTEKLNDRVDEINRKNISFEEKISLIGVLFNQHNYELDLFKKLQESQDFWTTKVKKIENLPSDIDSSVRERIHNDVLSTSNGHTYTNITFSNTTMNREGHHVCVTDEQFEAMDTNGWVQSTFFSKDYKTYMVKNNTRCYFEYDNRNHTLDIDNTVINTGSGTVHSYITRTRRSTPTDARPGDTLNTGTGSIVSIVDVPDRVPIVKEPPVRANYVFQQYKVSDLPDRRTFDYMVDAHTIKYSKDHDLSDDALTMFIDPNMTMFTRIRGHRSNIIKNICNDCGEMCNFVLRTFFPHVTVHCDEYRDAESRALEVPAEYTMAIMNPIDYCRFKSPKAVFNGSVRSYECNTLDCNYMLNDIPLPC